MNIDCFKDISEEKHPCVSDLKWEYLSRATPISDKRKERSELQSDILKVFLPTLSEEQDRMYDMLSDLNSEIEGEIETEHFIAGYKLATRLLIEGLR